MLFYLLYSACLRTGKKNFSPLRNNDTAENNRRYPLPIYP